MSDNQITDGQDGEPRAIDPESATLKVEDE